MEHTEIYGKLKGEKDAFQFGLGGGMCAELDAETVKAFQMAPALRRFGK